MITAKKYLTFTSTCQTCQQHFTDAQQASEHKNLTGHTVELDTQYNLNSYIQDLLTLDRYGLKRLK